MLRNAAVLAALALASTHALGASCEATVDGTDLMTYSVQSLDVSRGCERFTLHLTHTGTMPKTVMGHNWVLTTADDQPGVAEDGAQAGAEHDYLKPGDARVIAHTRLIGGGEADSTTFELSRLDPAQRYVFFCTYPGHQVLMKGTVALVP
ncbi:azurin [Pseudomonas sp. RIT-PI-S]|uniref:azurin n=1 Tax=Pseudomonas sp. RIT-PI-S TaxID=3035295 RepID=UPI0021D98095|nr:azurin [Pseudomonas sp. RIT-PI-S]